MCLESEVTEVDLLGRPGGAGGGGGSLTLEKGSHWGPAVMANHAD